jgi:hypothetical protein
MNLKEIFAKLFSTLKSSGQDDLVSPLPTDGSEAVTFGKKEDKYEGANVHPDDAFIFKGEKYAAGPKTEEFRQPPAEVAEILKDYFPDEATQSAVVAMSESGYNPDAVGTNANKSIDTGLFQINSNTFKDFMDRANRYGINRGKLEEYGISDYSQMKNPIFNAAMAKIIKDEQGWGAWYGPKDKGYNLDQGDLANYIKM